MNNAKLIVLSTLLLFGCTSNLPRVQEGAPPLEYKNVVVHDPSIMDTSEGVYYITGSHMAGARTSDLINWEQLSMSVQQQSWFQDIQTELKDVMEWGHTHTFWAGCLIQLKSGPYAGKYMMNYCVCQGGCPQGAIGYAIADKPEGPYHDKGVLLYSFGSRNTEDIYDAQTLAILRAGESGDLEAFADITAPDGTVYSAEQSREMIVSAGKTSGWLPEYYVILDISKIFSEDYYAYMVSKLKSPDDIRRMNSPLILLPKLTSFVMTTGSISLNFNATDRMTSSPDIRPSRYSSGKRFASPSSMKTYFFPFLDRSSPAAIFFCDTTLTASRSPHPNR